MLALKLDLSDDHINSYVVDPPIQDLLVDRFTGNDSGIVRDDLKNPMSFCEAPKIAAKRVFLHLRYADRWTIVYHAELLGCPNTVPELGDVQPAKRNGTPDQTGDGELT
jgi:hypothetical protein